ncbi:MAG: hypothetical protein ACLFMO_06055 [Eubacteriales bacterium]
MDNDERIFKDIEESVEDDGTFISPILYNLNPGVFPGMIGMLNEKREVLEKKDDYIDKLKR